MSRAGGITRFWFGSTAIGSPVIGALSDLAGPRYALGLGAAACLAAVVVGGWRGWRGWRRLVGP
jgi:hypothetical protein